MTIQLLSSKERRLLISAYYRYFDISKIFIHILHSPRHPQEPIKMGQCITRLTQ